MSDKIRITIIEDHQSIIDGYIYRLSANPQIEVVATVMFGEELESILAEHPTDVLIADINVPTAQDNRNPYPILHLIPKLLQNLPDLNILVISMYNKPTIIQAVMEAGASGYILKDDQTTIQDLANVVKLVANGGIHLSQPAFEKLFKRVHQESTLTSRQLEALSLCAAYPDASSAELANRLGVANSTFRNLLSGAYLHLNVHTRAAAIIEATQLGLIPPFTADIDK
jgi:two-component system nitrate/nitrite response regulator NarL